MFLQRLNVLMWRREPRRVLSPGDNPLPSPSLPGFKEGVRDITQKTIFSINNRECSYCLCWVSQRSEGRSVGLDLSWKPGSAWPTRPQDCCWGSPRSRCVPPTSPAKLLAVLHSLPVLLSGGKQLGVRVLSLFEGFSLQDRLRGGCQSQRVMLDGGS